MAAMYDSLNCISFLIECDVDLNSVDNTWETALHKAARCKFCMSYRMLISAGARKDVKNKMKETPPQLMHDATSY
jgi:hypothetical protein